MKKFLAYLKYGFLLVMWFMCISLGLIGAERVVDVTFFDTQARIASTTGAYVGGFFLFFVLMFFQDKPKFPKA